MTNPRAVDEVRQRAADDLANCPGHQVLGIIASKWVTLVMDALAAGPLGHAALRRAIPGVTQKMLTQTLRQLERDGLIDRTETASVPKRVDYEITALGSEILEVQRSIRAWAEDHIDAIHRARDRFDASTEPSARAGGGTLLT